MRQKSWNSISAWLRVLTNTSVVLLRLISSYISAIAWRALWPAHGRRSLVSSISTTGAAAPPATTMSADSIFRSRCGTRNRASDSGSATVADRPMPRISGASCHSRARPSDSRSPRLEVTSACNSSSTMRFSDENRNGASSEDNSSASCSGVVSSMSGG